MDRYIPLSGSHSDDEENLSLLPSSTSTIPPLSLEPEPTSDIGWGTWIHQRTIAPVLHYFGYGTSPSPSPDNASSSDDVINYEHNSTHGLYLTFALDRTGDSSDDSSEGEPNETLPSTWDTLCQRIKTDVTRFQNSPESTAAGFGWRVLKDVTIPPMISITVAGAVFELMQIIAGGLGINTQMRLANTFAKYPTWVIALVTQVIAHLHRNRYRPDIIKPLYDKAIDPLYSLLMPIIDTLGITAFLNQLSMATIAWIMRVAAHRPKGSDIFIPNAAAYSSIALDFVLAGAAARLNRVQETLEISGDLDTPIPYLLARSEGFSVEPPRTQAISRLNWFDRFLLHKASRVGFYGITAMATFHEFFFDLEALADLDTEAPAPFWTRMVMTFLPAFIAGYLQYRDEPSDSRLMISFNGLQTFMTIALILVTFFGYIYGAPPETQVYSGIVEVLSYLWPTLLALSTGFALINVAHDWPQITNQQPLVDEEEPTGLDRRLGSRRHVISSGTTLFSRSSPSVGMPTRSKSSMLLINSNPFHSDRSSDEFLEQQLNLSNLAAQRRSGPHQLDSHDSHFSSELALSSSSSSDDESDTKSESEALSAQNANESSQSSPSSSTIVAAAAADRYKSAPLSLLFREEEEPQGSLPKADTHKYFSMQPSTSQE